MLTTLKRAMKRAAFLSRPSVILGEARYRLPRFQPLGYSIDEPWMLELLKRIVRQEDGAFVDIGVNVGQTLLCAKTAAPDVAYVGFDPNPRCIAYAEAIAEANALRDVTLICAAVGDRIGLSVLEFYSENSQDAAASTVAGYRPGETVYARKAITMIPFEDAVRLVGDRPVGTIKIDVEGGEAAVLASLAPHLSDHRPLIVLEVLPADSEDYAHRIKAQKDMETRLGQVDYVLNRIAKTPARTFAGAHEVDGFGIHSDLTQCDYIAVPREKMGGIAAALAG